MRRTPFIAAAIVGTGLAARRAAERRVQQWTEAPDPTEGEPMVGPEGTAVSVTTNDGSRLVGIDAGQGPAVLLVHGWSGTVGHFAPVAKRLVAAGFRTISVDQRGHGGSDLGTDGMTAVALAGDIKAWVESLDLDDAVLVGHSMGGFAIQSFALEHSDTAARVKAFVLVSTLAATIDAGAEATVLGRLLRSGVVSKLVARPKYGMALTRGAVGVTVARSHLEAMRSTWLTTMPAALVGAHEMMLHTDFRDRLGTIAVPTSIIVGTHDNLTPQGQNEELARLIPGATIEVVSDMGHMLPWEAPDRVTDLIVQAHTPR
jgi:non-heme chloroperoxidase